MIMKVMIQRPARNPLHKLGINETWGIHIIVLMREYGYDFHFQKELLKSNIAQYDKSDARVQDYLI